MLNLLVVGVILHMWDMYVAWCVLSDNPGDDSMSRGQCRHVSPCSGKNFFIAWLSVSRDTLQPAACHNLLNFGAALLLEHVQEVHENTDKVCASILKT